MVRNKTKLKTLSPFPSLHTRLTFTSNSSTSFSWAVQVHGKYDFGSVHKALSLLHILLHTQFSSSSMDSHPWATVLHERLNCASSHRLQFFKNCSGMVPFHVVHENPSGTDYSSVGPPWYHCPARSLLLHGLSTGCSFPQGKLYPPAPSVDPQWPAEWMCAPPWSSLGCKGTACLTTVLALKSCFSHIFSILSPNCCCKAFFTLS